MTAVFSKAAGDDSFDGSSGADNSATRPCYCQPTEGFVAVPDTGTYLVIDGVARRARPYREETWVVDDD